MKLTDLSFVAVDQISYLLHSATRKESSVRFHSVFHFSLSLTPRLQRNNLLGVGERQGEVRNEKQREREFAMSFAGGGRDFKSNTSGHSKSILKNRERKGKIKKPMLISDFPFLFHFFITLSFQPDTAWHRNGYKRQSPSCGLESKRL